MQNHFRWACTQLKNPNNFKTFIENLSEILSSHLNVGHDVKAGIFALKRDFGRADPSMLCNPATAGDIGAACKPLPPLTPPSLI
jgi:hypothetical protein